VKIMTLRINGIISPGISGQACRSELKPRRDTPALHEGGDATAAKQSAERAPTARSYRP